LFLCGSKKNNRRVRGERKENTTQRIKFCASCFLRAFVAIKQFNKNLCAIFVSIVPLWFKKITAEYTANAKKMQRKE
jgi:hypothetical protein